MTGVPNLIRILAVDDHPLLRKGIAALVNAEADMKLVAGAIFLSLFTNLF